VQRTLRKASEEREDEPVDRDRKGMIVLLAYISASGYGVVLLLISKMISA
jgi:hypothetical protein